MSEPSLDFLMHLAMFPGLLRVTRPFYITKEYQQALVEGSPRFNLEYANDLFKSVVTSPAFRATAACTRSKLASGCIYS